MRVNAIREQRTEVRGQRLPYLSSVFCLLFSVFCSLSPAFAAPLLIDDFEGEGIQNRMGGRTNVYVRAPSRVMMSRTTDSIQGKKSQVLLIRYDKKAEGGPYNSGGWCGYYSLFKTPGHLVAPTPEDPNPELVGEQYLDAGAFKAVTFWVRGEIGDEDFMVGLADRHWDQVGDSVKSEKIGIYLAGGKLTTEWQKAVVPLDTFFLDYAKLASISICFEGDLFPEGGSGTVYIDDIALE